MSHTGIQENLSVYLSAKTKRHSEVMCKPYAFLVYQGGMTSYAAFVSFSAFRRWLKERGLKIKGNRILGVFEKRPTASLEGLKGLHTRELCNGEYREAIITEENGIKIVNFHWTGVYDPNTRQSIEDFRKFEKIHCG